MKLKTIPTEAEEQIKLVQWLRLKKLDHWHTPNSTYTKSWKQKTMNKALGVSAGIPDLAIIVNNQLIMIEMKRCKGGSVTVTQKEWIGKLNTAGVPTKVCSGYDQAIAFINQFMV